MPPSRPPWTRRRRRRWLPRPLARCQCSTRPAFPSCTTSCRAFQLSRTLPDALLQRFEQATATLPRTTEAERLVVQRVGQELFRGGLLEYWQGRCAITGLAVPELLRASHIKPWAACETDAERLDVFNGLLLAPHLDAVFDSGLVTVDENGTVVVSTRLDPAAQSALGLDGPLRARGLSPAHERYLRFHRASVFRHPTPGTTALG